MTKDAGARPSLRVALNNLSVKVDQVREQIALIPPGARFPRFAYLQATPHIGVSG